MTASDARPRRTENGRRGGVTPGPLDGGEPHLVEQLGGDALHARHDGSAARTAQGEQSQIGANHHHGVVATHIQLFAPAGGTRHALAHRLTLLRSLACFLRRPL